MKAKLIYPHCQRCGYQFDPKRPDKAVYQFVSDDADYIACTDCIAELGRIVKTGTEEQKQAFIQEFKFKPEKCEN